MNNEKIQKLAHLQIQICTGTERIDYLKNAIRQLADNRCNVAFAFHLHNEDQHQENVNQKSIDELNAEHTLMGPSVTYTKVTPCTLQFNHKISESLGIRMLDFMYQEELKLQKERVKEMAMLLEVHFNPIMAAHNIFE